MLIVVFDNSALLKVLIKVLSAYFPSSILFFSGLCLLFLMFSNKKFLLGIALIFPKISGSSLLFIKLCFSGGLYCGKVPLTTNDL